MKKTKPKRIMLLITLITLTCKVLGFLKNSVMAYYFGTSLVVDAYVMTFSIGTITSGWIAGLIGNFTPIFKEIETHKGKVKALLFSSQAINLILVLVLFLIAILETLAPTVVKLVAPGFKNETYRFTVHFFRIYCISIFFYTLFRFSQEFLNCNQNHIAAISPDLFMSSFCIVAIVISRYVGADYLIFGYVIATLLQSIIAHISSRKIGFRFRKTELWNANLKELIKMAIPIFLSDTLANINNLIDKVFASNLESGIVASLDYANTMKEFAYQVGTIAIVTVVFPIISKYWAEKNIDEFKKRILEGLDFFTVLYVPLIVGIILVGDIAIRIVFKRGEFSETAAIITSNAFVVYSINLIAMAYRCIFLKAFYAMQKTKYIFAVSFINVAFNIFLNFILVKRLGYIGLTSATTLAALVCMPIYFFLFRRTIYNVSYKLFLIKIGKCIVAAAFMGTCIYCIRLNLENVFSVDSFQMIILLGVLTIIGIIIYVVSCVFLRVEEVNRFFNSTVMKYKSR